MPSLRSEVRQKVARLVDEIFSSGRRTARQIAEAILNQEPEILDKDARHWKTETLMRMVKTHLKRNSEWITDLQGVLPGMVLEQRLPTAINIRRTIMIESEGEVTEVQEVEWVPSEFATVAELKRYCVMLERSIQSDTIKYREARIWLDFYESSIEDGEDSQTIDEINLRLRDSA